MKRYNTKCFFLSKDSITENIILNDSSSIEFISHGNECIFSDDSSIKVSNGYIYGVEIITDTDKNAEYIVDLFCASHTVINGFICETSEDIINRMHCEESIHNGVFYGDDSLYYSCIMTKKAINEQKDKNAIFKYYIAKLIYSSDPMQLHPFNDPFINEYLLSERIKIANIIGDCYSVLEEINVQINASNNNPSTINNKWNEIVKNELCERLKKQHIDPLDSIPWLTRNGIIRPFKEVVNTKTLCEWSDGKEICDFKINICDAILELSYIRSNKATHVLGDKVLLFSVYDAENAFSLSRYILMNYFSIRSIAHKLKIHQMTERNKIMENWESIRPVVETILRQARCSRNGNYDGEPCFLTAYQIAVLVDQTDNSLKGTLTIGGANEGPDSFAKQIAWHLSRDINDNYFNDKLEIGFFSIKGLDSFTFDNRKKPSADEFSMFKLSD
ncbi:hypothetical protein EOM82_06610 [bacterium]|nr:hypothetical protein [bacterium]